MRRGDVINGYRILKDFTTAGGGLSKWTFAERSEQQYFIKEFLSPKYPTPESPGSAETKRRKMSHCDAFEAHHRRMKDALGRRCGRGGNLVITLDFFREGTTYYKTTERIDVTSLSITEISSLSFEQKLLILKTVVHSLAILHGESIVHGDLKPNNVLIKKNDAGNFTTKLIDFDNSFLSGDPPPPEEIVGDMVFYSPEYARYVDPEVGCDRRTMSTKSDIFALGLLYHLYLTGRMPYSGDDKGSPRYCCIAVEGGAKLPVGTELRRAAPSEAIGLRLLTLVEQMLMRDPRDRPDAGSVLRALKDAARDSPLATRSPSPGDTRSPNPELRGTLIGKPAPPPSAPTKGGGLRGKLIKKS